MAAAHQIEVLDEQSLRAGYTDMVENLAAALARIEAYRVRERHLIDELSQLRQQVHSHPQVHSHQAEDATGPSAAGQKPAAVTIGSRSDSEHDLRPQRTCSIQLPNTSNLQPEYTSTSSAPVYVTEANGEYPVKLVHGTKRTPCSLIVANDHIDFVELKTRIHKDEFMGISTVKGMQKAASHGGLCLCCFSRPQVEFSDMDMAAVGASSQGHLDETASTSGQEGMWMIYCKSTPGTPRIVFEASQLTRSTLHRHTEKWLGVEVAADADGDEAGPATASADTANLAPPRPLIPTTATLTLTGEPSQIATPDQLRALASAVPPLERMRPWALSYGTRVHGTSLSTLYRRMTAGVPTITLVKDHGGYIFGAYTPEAWRIAPRFYGSGESFVFNLEPHRTCYGWWVKSGTKNDFFQYSTPDCLAMGGDGHFALHLDSELLHGSSGRCGTFGSPCLATSEDFRIAMLEVWQVVP